jgi:tRNA (adenine37-N6)-methyltransferase
VEKGARRPRARADWPKMGIFAQRSKDRPNRSGITICTLLFVQGLEIRLSEPDAVDDTPLLDVKPYLKGFAPRGEVREPAWAKELMAGYFCKAERFLPWRSEHAGRGENRRSDRCLRFEKKSQAQAGD